MNHNCDKLERMLEQATSRDADVQNKLTGEAAALGEAWVAFGRLLETAEPTNEPDIVPWVAPRSTANGARRLHRWVLSAVSLLAASLLIAVTVWTLGVGRVDKASQQASTAGQTVKPEATAPSEMHVAGTPQTPAATKVATAGTKWDDSWDEQVTNVGQAFAYAQHELYAGPNSVSSVQYGIEQMQQDITGNKL